jgi:hypothetical protein
LLLRREHRECAACPAVAIPGVEGAYFVHVADPGVDPGDIVEGLFEAGLLVHRSPSKSVLTPGIGSQQDAPLGRWIRRRVVEPADRQVDDRRSAEGRPVRIGGLPASPPRVAAPHPGRAEARRPGGAAAALRARCRDRSRSSRPRYTAEEHAWHGTGEGDRILREREKCRPDRQVFVRQARYDWTCVPSQGFGPAGAASTSQAAPTGHSSDRRRCGFSDVDCNAPARHWRHSFRTTSTSAGYRSRCAPSKMASAPTEQPRRLAGPGSGPGAIEQRRWSAFLIDHRRCGFVAGRMKPTMTTELWRPFSRRSRSSPARRRDRLQSPGDG